MQENSQIIIIKEEGSKEEDRQEEADVKIIVMNVYADLNDAIKMTKVRRFLSGQIVANTELQNK